MSIVILVTGICIIVLEIIGFLRERKNQKKMEEAVAELFNKKDASM